MTDYDVIVVGAGPAGLAASQRLAEKNLKVLVLDRKQEIGCPKRCAEGLGLGWFKRLNIKPDKAWAVNPIYGAALYSPKGKIVEIKAKKVAGYVLERKMFEKFLAREAVSKGAEIRLKADVENARRENGKVVLDVVERGESRQYSSPLIIAADGIDSRIARFLGMNTTSKLPDVDSGYQYEMAGIDGYDEKLLHLYFGTEIAPRGYCLTGDTEIFVKNSIKEISKVSEGEEVLTGHGLEQVKAVSKRSYEGKIIGITPALFNKEAKFTPEHLILVWNKNDGYVWRKAKDLKKSIRGSHRGGDNLVFPLPKKQNKEFIELKEFINLEKFIKKGNMIFPKGRNQFGAEFPYKYGIPEKIRLTPELMEFFGYFVSEGNTNSNGIIISNTNKEIVDKVSKLGEKLFHVKPNYWMQKVDRKPCVQVGFSSKILKALFAAMFGVGCENKKVPPFFYGLDDELKLSFLVGLFRGDGGIEKTSEGYDKLVFTTISKHLIYDVWILLSSLEIGAAIGYIRKKNAYRIGIRGTQLDKLERIFGRLKHGTITTGRFMFRDGNLLMALRKIQSYSNFNGYVYDIQTNGSFCPGFIVHNCWIFPKRKGTANVGIGIGGFEKKSAKYYLDKFIASHPNLSKGSIIEVNAGGIPVGGFLDEMAADNLLVCGDAAHQVDPIHGGGMGIAIEAARMAADTAVEAVKKNDYSSKFLNTYSAKWYKNRGNELRKRLKGRNLLEKLTDADFEYLAESITGEEILKIASGDMDKKTKLALFAKKLVKRPGLIKIMMKAMR